MTDAEQNLENLVKRYYANGYTQGVLDAAEGTPKRTVWNLSPDSSYRKGYEKGYDATVAELEALQ